MQSPPVTTGAVSPFPPSITQPHKPEMMHNHPPVPLYTPSTTTAATTYSVHDHHRSLSLPTIFTPPTVSPAPAPTSHVDPVSTPDIHQASITAGQDNITQPPGYLGQPLFDLKNHSFEPVRTHNGHGVRSTAEIGDHLDHHGHTEPQIFHPVHQPMPNGIHSTTPPVGNITPPLGIQHPGRKSPLPKGTRALSPHPAIPVAPMPSHPIMTSTLTHPAMPITSTLAHPTSMNNAANINPIAIKPGVITSPAPPRVGHFQPSVPPPQIQPHIATPPAARTPTPPSGLTPPLASRSTGSTPRCLSPEEDDSGMSDEEGLKATIDALNDVIQKFTLEVCRII